MFMRCHCCGEEITAPKFHSGHSYGWACYNKLFGKTKKAIRYVPVKCANVIRNWDSCIETLSEESKESFRGLSKISFTCPGVIHKKLKFLGSSDFAYQVGDQWFVPETAVKKYIDEAKRKSCYESA